MGWTYTHELTSDLTYRSLTNKERKGVIDEWRNRNGTKVLKSSMVGTTYYGAIKKSSGEVFAIIYLTSGADKNDPYFNFGYKDMDETCGPCECSCPSGILELLTPTKSESANDWRRRCREYNHMKNKSTWLKKLPLGNRIVWTGRNGEEHILTKHAPAYQFKTWFWYDAIRNVYIRKSLVNCDNAKVFD